MVAAIWSTSRDVSADLVERELVKRAAPYLRVDTDRYGDRCSFAWSERGAWFETASGRVGADELTTVFYRRPAVTEIPREDRDFAIHEAWYFGRASLLCAPQARWMNHPAAVLEAENKLRQLKTARDLSFRVPLTVLTSDPADAWAFYEAMSQCICKPGYAGLIANNEGARAVYAARVPQGLSLADFESVRSCPTLLQEEIPKRADIRLTVVGHEQLAVRILSSDPERVDWRRDILTGRLSYERTLVPDAVGGKIRDLMDRLGITFGAFDFAETASGEWVFLEVNPAGQWGWLEDAAGVPIAGAIADWLADAP